MSDSEEDIFAPKTATRCGREVKPAERFKPAKPAGPQARSILDSCDFLSKVLLLLSPRCLRGPFVTARAEMTAHAHN